MILSIADSIKSHIKNEGVKSTTYKSIRWLLDYNSNKIKRYYHNRDRKLALNPFETIYVDPNDIKYMLIESEKTYKNLRENPPTLCAHELEKAAFYPALEMGYVLDGDWDQYKKPYKYDRIYASLNKHFNKNTRLEDTEYGQHLMLMDLNNGREEIKKIKKEIYELKRSIEEKGVLTPYELNTKQRFQPIYSKPWGISVNIGRDGDIIFNNWQGHHRLALAKILDLDSVPVVVTIRHSQWEQIRQKIYYKCGDYIELAEENNHHPDILLNN